MIEELVRVADEMVVVASPYWWECEETAVEEWLDSTVGASEEAVRSTLAAAGARVVAERVRVPWILRYNARAFMVFLCHVIVAEVGRAQSAAAGEVVA